MNKKIESWRSGQIRQTAYDSSTYFFLPSNITDDYFKAEERSGDLMN
ncbi:MAG: hypothetical protein ACLT8I_23655 [Blautia faecis]